MNKLTFISIVAAMICGCNQSGLRTETYDSKLTPVINYLSQLGQDLFVRDVWKQIAILANSFPGFVGKD